MQDSAKNATQVAASAADPVTTPTVEQGPSNTKRIDPTQVDEESLAANPGPEDVERMLTATPTKSPTPTVLPTAALLRWSTQTADPATRGGLYSTLLFDKNETLHIAYLDNENDKLMVSINNQHNWYPVRMPGKSRSGWYPSITMNQAGNLYISYWAFGKDWISYFYQNNNQWIAGPQLNNVQPTGTAITLDSTNRVGIYFIDRNDGWLKYASQTNSGWNVTRVSQPYPSVSDVPEEGANLALTTDSKGNAHLAYYSSAQGLVYQQVESGKVNLTEGIDGGFRMGLFPSITLDKSGKPVISYYDFSGQKLKLARKAGDSWTISVIDDDGNVGQYSSIKVGSTGIIYISYYDASNQALKFARVGEGNAANYTIIDRGGVGKWNSLALDTNNLPQISYYDEKNEHVKFAWASYE